LFFATEEFPLESLIGLLGNAWSVLVLLIGLGFVIFVHELGHFAVAKWVGVCVERFSIGFGPVLWSFRRGETEYALSAIPFGGYVKMLGQDDANPTEMTRDDLKLDPRSYPAQTVPKRMAIISAGVIMNIIFGFIFFLIVFNVGVPYTPALVAAVEPGSPAWQVGIERGDKIVRVNGEEVVEFEQLMQAVVLSDKSGLDLEIVRGDTTHSFHVVADMTNSAPQIGVAPPMDLTLDKDDPVRQGLAAANTVGEAFKGGDRITHVDGNEMRSYSEFMDYLASHADEELTVTVARAVKKGETAQTAEIRVPRQCLRDLGLRFQMGKITALRADSPADRAGIKVGDVIQSVANQPVDPLRLSDVLSKLAGREVEIELKRESQGDEIVRIPLTPDDRPAWLTPPYGEGDPLTAPSIGIAYQLVPAVTEHPKSDSPAAKAGLKKDDRIVAAYILTPPKEGEQPAKPKAIPIDDEHKLLPVIFWELQHTPDARLQFKVKRDGKEIETDAFSPEIDSGWFNPRRGIKLGLPLQVEMEPQGFSRAIALGYKTTKSTMTSIYLMLRRLIISRTVSPKLLSGPLGIVDMGYRVAQADIRMFIKFLAILSVNLAIINFLPIPVLDGGHMVMLAWEGIRGKPPSERVVIAANYCGLLLILCLALFVTWNDIARFVR
jgi:regulator of sigma E protease